jgi:hypothetical protein
MDVENNLISVPLNKSFINRWCFDSLTDGITIDFSRGYEGGDIILQFHGIYQYMMSGDLSERDCFYVASIHIFKLDNPDLKQQIINPLEDNVLCCKIEGAICMEIIFRNYQIFKPNID